MTISISISMSKLWYLGAITSGITALTIPNMRKKAASVMLGLTVNELFGKFYGWLKFKHPEKKSLNNSILALKTLCNLYVLRYVTTTIPILSQNHKGFNGTMHNLICKMYSWQESITYWSFWLSCVGTTFSTILFPIINIFCNRLINNSARNITNHLQNLVINVNGINVINTSPNTLTFEAIEKIAPARCAGLHNNAIDAEKDVEFSHPENCAVCMEKYDDTQLTRILPCKHSFHASCVDEWLMKSSAICPLCRKDIRINLNPNPNPNPN
jgi:hypothetical protein